MTIKLTLIWKQGIRNFASFAYPLYKLLKKNAKFSWTHETEQAFEKLKQILTEAPVLIFCLEMLSMRQN